MIAFWIGFIAGAALTVVTFFVALLIITPRTPDDPHDDNPQQF